MSPLSWSPVCCWVLTERSCFVNREWRWWLRSTNPVLSEGSWQEVSQKRWNIMKNICLFFFFPYWLQQSNQQLCFKWRHERASFDSRLIKCMWQFWENSGRWEKLPSLCVLMYCCSIMHPKNCSYMQDISVMCVCVRYDIICFLLKRRKLVAKAQIWEEKK